MINDANISQIDALPPRPEGRGPRAGFLVNGPSLGNV